VKASRSGRSRMADVTAVPRASENDASGDTTFPVCRFAKSSREPWRLTRPNIRLTDVLFRVSDEKVPKTKTCNRNSLIRGILECKLARFLSPFSSLSKKEIKIRDQIS